MVQQAHTFLTGECVKVVRGPLASYSGTSGKVQRVMENNEVLILLDESESKKQESEANELKPKDSEQKDNSQWVCTLSAS